MSIPLRNAALYAEHGTGAYPHAPALRGVLCSCGHRAFPPQRQGCEVCGGHGDALADALFTGHGRLLSSATVHRHGKPFPPVPFTVVSVALDDGPVVRGLLAAASPAGLKPGTLMLTVLETVNIGDEPLRDLRFVAEGA